MQAAARGGSRPGTSSSRTPAAGAQRRLERTIARYRGCLGDLTPRERRVLMLRAGLDSGAALSRTQVARRLSLGVARVSQLERAGLRRLAALGATGACGASTVADAPPASFLGPAALGGAAPPAFPTPVSGAHGAVEGAVASGGGGGDPGIGAPPPLGHGGEVTWLIALLLIVTVALLVRWELRRR